MGQSTLGRRVQWGDTDSAGIVFYPNYFRWFDQATHELFRDIGYPVVSMLSRGFAIPIIEAQGRFLAPLAYEDELVITSTIREVRTRAFRVEHTVNRGEERVCEGYEVRIWAHLSDTGRSLQPESLPDDLRALLTATQE